MSDSFCDPMDYSQPGFSVNGISQAGVLQWIAFPSPVDLSTQGLNLCLLHWQVDSLPLSHQGSPIQTHTHTHTHTYTHTQTCIYESPSWITGSSWQSGLYNSMKLRAMPCRVTQGKQVTVKISDKLWSTGVRNGNPPQYSCL